jgi:hypothetical protein
MTANMAANPNQHLSLADGRLRCIVRSMTE